MTAPSEQSVVIAEFWAWFSAKGADLLHELDASTGRQLPPLLAELESRLKTLDSELGWEIGPHGDGMYLAISPEGDSERYRLTQAVVSAATLPRRWVAFAAKPPKDWNRTLEFAGRLIDASNWAFYLEKTGQTHHVHFGVRYPLDLTVEQLAELGRVVLESDLGEAFALEHVSQISVELLDQWPDAVRGRHISDLWSRLGKGQG